MFLLEPRIVQEIGVNVKPEESPGLNGLVSVPMAEHLHKKLKTGRNFYNNKPGPTGGLTTSPCPWLPHPPASCHAPRTQWH